MKSLRPLVSGGFLGLLLVGCSAQPIAPKTVSAAGQSVEFAMDTPSDHLFDMVAELRISDVQDETDEALRSARAELRNRAAELGASLVTVDEETGERVWFQDAVKVTVVGRAFRPKD